MFVLKQAAHVVLGAQKLAAHLISEHLVVGATESLVLQFLSDLNFEILVTDARAIHIREQIIDESFEQRYIFKNEFRHVAVTQRAHEHQVLRHLRVLSFKASRHDEDRLESA